MSTIFNEIKKLEGRDYPESWVKGLPSIPSNHPHFGEWEVRKRYAQKIISILKGKNYSSLLDIGCGNGWLASKLMKELNLDFADGFDPDEKDIEMAQRCFGTGKICFYHSSFEKFNSQKKFDVILFFASLHYLESIESTLAICQNWLSDKGIIVISNTMFYETHEVQQAKNRSIRYFKYLNINPNNVSYYHHLWTSIKGYKPLFIKPRIWEKIWRKILNKPTLPFPIIVIPKKHLESI